MQELLKPKTPILCRTVPGSVPTIGTLALPATPSGVVDINLIFLVKIIGRGIVHRWSYISQNIKGGIKSPLGFFQQGQFYIQNMRLIQVITEDFFFILILPK